jgi:hypothetical protein
MHTRNHRPGRGVGARPRCRACIFFGLFFLHAERAGSQNENHADFRSKSRLSGNHRFKSEIIGAHSPRPIRPAPRPRPGRMPLGQPLQTHTAKAFQFDLPYKHQSSTSSAVHGSQIALIKAMPLAATEGGFSTPNSEVGRRPASRAGVAHFCISPHTAHVNPRPLQETAGDCMVVANCTTCIICRNIPGARCTSKKSAGYCWGGRCCASYISLHAALAAYTQHV